VGRKRIYAEGAVTTTVRVSLPNWEFLKGEKLQLTPWVNSRLGRERLAKEEDERIRYLEELRANRRSQEGVAKPSSQVG